MPSVPAGATFYLEIPREDGVNLASLAIADGLPAHVIPITSDCDTLSLFTGYYGPVSDRAAPSDSKEVHN